MVAVGTIQPDEHPLVPLDRVDVGEPLGEHLLGPHDREPLLQVNQRELVEGLPLFLTQFAGRRHRERYLSRERLDLPVGHRLPVTAGTH